MVTQEIAADRTTADPPVRKDALRYDDKTFDEWRHGWRTELKPERRTEAIKAFAAFGAHGYGKEATAAIERLSGEKIAPGSGLSIKPISEAATARIVRYAFDYAIANGRRKVTSVHKANIMKFTDGLWLEVSRQVA